MTLGIKVLVVDDSAVVREALRNVFLNEKGIAAVETAADGQIALRRIERFNPDVITMDIEMPGLDGLATLKRIMTLSPRPVIMLSGYTFQGARKTIRALELGAVDFIQKPGGPGSRDIAAVTDELVAKVLAVGSTPLRRERGLSAPPAELDLAPAPRVRRAPSAPLDQSPVLVAVGASTGGTEAIRYLVGALPATLNAGIVVTQHMPEGFTLAFANRLNELSSLEVKEAAQHDLIRPGRVLIAPGHSHLRVCRERGVAYVELDRRPPVNNHRPAVDVMFGSAAQVFGAMTVSLLLTGMGKDGANGMLELRRAGGVTIAESEESCVVFGMPKAAIDLGAAEHVCRMAEMPALVEKQVAIKVATLRRMRQANAPSPKGDPNAT